MNANELAEKLDHPCKGTCSGWQQGYEKGHAAGYGEGLERAAKLLDAFHAISGEHAELAHLIRDLKKESQDG